MGTMISNNTDIIDRKHQYFQRNKVKKVVKCGAHYKQITNFVIISNSRGKLIFNDYNEVIDCAELFCVCHIFNFVLSTFLSQLDI